MDVDAVGRLGRVHESARNGDLNAPYRGLVPYGGRVGSEGTALFLATCAATANALDGDPRSAVAAVHVAARLMGSGADVNAIGARPGWRARCGARLTPVSICLAALEQTASLTDRAAYVSSRVAIASLASALIRGNDFDHAVEATFSHRPDADELRVRRVAPGDASTTPLAPGSTKHFGSDARPPVYASGPALWHACCAVVEGAGAPALSLARELLAMGADPNCVGSRPGHCAAGTPALAMCVAALEGRAATDGKKAWWPSTDGVAGSRVPSTLSVRASVSDGGATDGGGSAPSTSSRGGRKLHPVDGEETGAEAGAEAGAERVPRGDLVDVEDDSVRGGHRGGDRRGFRLASEEHSGRGGGCRQRRRRRRRHHARLTTTGRDAPGPMRWSSSRRSSRAARTSTLRWRSEGPTPRISSRVTRIRWA